MKFVLASASPRRRQLLEPFDIEWQVMPASIDETPLPSETPEVYVERMSQEKAFCVSSKLSGDRVVLAADTIVVQNKAILGKPSCDKEAFETLAKLSGSTHKVLTAFSIHLSRESAPIQFGRCVETQVAFRCLSPAEIENYLSTGEHRDKAGSYGIQGLAGCFVEEINGSYSNVVGLPLSQLLQCLRADCAIPMQFKS